MLKDSMKKVMQSKKDIVVLPFGVLSHVIKQHQEKTVNSDSIPEKIDTSIKNQSVSYVQPYKYIQQVLEPLKSSSLNLSTKKESISRLQLEELSFEFQKQYGISTLNRSSKDYCISLTNWFMEYLEEVAKLFVIKKKSCGLTKIMNSDEFINPLVLQNLIWSYSGISDGYLNSYAKSEQSHSLICLLGIICNCDRNKTAAILASLLGISLENLYNFTADRHVADIKAKDNFFLTIIPTYLAEYTLYDQKNIIGFSKQNKI